MSDKPRINTISGGGARTRIGRVGALALALGVGVALAGTPGIAWADTSGTNSSGSSSGTSSGSSWAADSSADSTADSKAGSQAGGASDVNSDADSTSETVSDDAKVGDGRGGKKTDDADAAGSTKAAEPKKDGAAKRDAGRRSGSSRTAKDADSAKPARTGAADADAGSASGRDVSRAADKPAAQQAAPTVAAKVTSVEAPRALVAAVVQAPASLAASVAPRVADAPAAVTGVVSSLVSSVFGPALAGSAGGSPVVPAPALLTLLAAARREIGGDAATTAASAESVDTAAKTAAVSTLAAPSQLTMAAAAAPSPGDLTPDLRDQNITVELNPTDVTAPIPIDLRNVNKENITFTILGSDKPAKGTVTFNQATDTFVYDPVNSFATTGGTDDFTLVATRTVPGSTRTYKDTSKVTIKVVPKNDAPIAGNDTFTTVEDTPKQITATQLLANDTDPDGTKPTLTGAFTQPAKGTVAYNSTTKVLTYTPKADATGPDTFTYTITDGKLTGVGTVTVNVTPVNDAPRPGTPPVTTNPADPATGAVTGKVNAADPDAGATLAYKVASGPTSGSLVLNQATGTFTYTPTTAARLRAANAASVQAQAVSQTSLLNQTGPTSDSFTVTVTDQTGASTTIPVSVTIDAASYEVDTIELGDRPWGPTVSSDGKKVYVAMQGSDTTGDGRGLAVIDSDPTSATYNQVVDFVELPDIRPYAATWVETANGSRLYVSSAGDGVTAAPKNRVVVLDPANDYAQVAEINLATDGTSDTQPWRFVVSPNGDYVYVLNKEVDTVSKIDTSTNTVVATIPFGQGVPDSTTQAFAISPDGSRVYAVENSGVRVIDTASNTVVGSVTGTPQNLGMLAFMPDGKRAYLTVQGSPTVLVIDTDPTSATYNQVMPEQVDLSPENLPSNVVVNSDGTLAYFTAYAGNVYVVDTATNTVIDTVQTQLPTGTRRMVFAPDGRLYVVTNNAYGRVGEGGDSVLVLTLT